MIFRACQFEFTFPRPALIMGIVNVTPDSFSDGGQFLEVKAAVAHALQLVEEGAEMRLGCVVADDHGTCIEQGSDTLPPFGGRDAVVPWAIAVCNHEMSSQTESKQTGARRRHPANVGLGRLFPSSPYLRYVFIFVRIVQSQAR